MIDLSDVQPLRPVLYDLDAIVVGLRDTAERWVPRHFPNGRREGDSWRLANIKGDPPRKQGSCVITLAGPHAGDWIDFDGSGGGGPLSALEQPTGLSGRDLFHYAAEMLSLSTVSRRQAAGAQAQPAAATNSRDQRAEREIELILASTRPIDGSPVERYLATRGLSVPSCPDVLSHPDLTHWDTQTGYPGIVATVRDRDGRRIGLHRTYLAPDGSGKAPVGKARKMLGSTAGGTVRLAPVAAGVIGLAEGIETALSIMAACPDLPVWAALSTSGVAEALLPPDVQRVILLADNDVNSAGLRAARMAAERFHAEGRQVFLAAPPQTGDDFNDLLLREGPEAVRAVVHAAAPWADLAKPATPTGTPAPNNPLADDPLAGGMPLEFTEEALALEFTARHADDLRYCAVWGRWLLWDTQRWRMDETLRGFDLSRRICRESSNRALVKVRDVKAAAKLASVLASAKTVAAVERLAKADRRHAATTDQWDTDPWVLNTPGGMVDLRSGRVLPHRREAHLTKITAAAPEGDCPMWLAFLHRVTAGDEDLQAFLQRIAGYALTGTIRDHALFFLYGTGRNGKGVFLNTLTGILADYAVVASMETFTATTGDRHTTDLAMLRGARLVTAQETEEGRRWAESRIKAMTGGDPITARFMRQDNFTFLPQFKLVIAGNHKPGLRNVDEAMRARFHLIPFTVRIPKAERDPELPEKLKGEWSGILRWAVEGCLAWQRDGLEPPQCVLDATAAYMEVEDALGRFLEDRCVVADKDRNTGEDNAAELSELFASWQEWCRKTGEYAGTTKRFSQNMEARGFIRWQHPRTRQRGFRGVRLVVRAAAPGYRGDLDD